MPRVSTRAIWLAVFLLVTACTTVAQSRTQSDEGRLLSAWSLVSAERVHTDGTTQPTLLVRGADHAKGTLVYSPDGIVSVQIAGYPRPRFSRTSQMPDPDATTGADLLNTYYAYSGRYEVDAGHKVVRHFVDQSLYSGEDGKTYERRYKLNGDTLTLETEPVAVNGKVVINRLVWRRVVAKH